MTFLWQELRPYVNGFPLGWCDHNTLWVTLITTIYWKEKCRCSPFVLSLPLRIGTLTNDVWPSYFKNEDDKFLEFLLFYYQGFPKKIYNTVSHKVSQTRDQNAQFGWNWEWIVKKEYCIKGGVLDSFHHPCWW